MARLRSSHRRLSTDRQAALLGQRNPTAEIRALVAPQESGLLDLARFAGVGLVSAALLYVATLPGGIEVVTLMFVGSFVGGAALVLRSRMSSGPQRRLPKPDPVRFHRRRIAQQLALRREFGAATRRLHGGRHVEVLDVRLERIWLLVDRSGDLCAAIGDTGSDDLVFVRGGVLASELHADRPVGARWRLERLPRTHGLLSMAIHGTSIAPEVIALTDPSLIGHFEECAVVQVEQLPTSWRGTIGMPVPYR